MPELVIGAVAVLLSLAVLSRVFGDNPLFRATQYLFIGSSLGYAFLVVYFQVLRPTAIQLLLMEGGPIITGLRAVPFVLGLLLLPRAIGRQVGSWLANIPLAVIFGVTMALAFGGALVGTLLPQLLDTVVPQAGLPQLIGALVSAFALIAVLLSFRFTQSAAEAEGKPSRLSLDPIARMILVITFGVVFAGAITTYIAALNNRIDAVISWGLALFGAR